MRDHTYISNIEDLERWFVMNQGKESRPYFTLYRGYEAKNDRYIFSNKEISEPDEAWKALQEVLEMFQDGGGNFRLFLTDRPGHNFGVTTLVKLPGRNMQAAGAPGIYGAQQHMQFGIYGSFPEMLRAELDRERKIWELEAQIEAMQQQGAVSGVEQIRQVFEAVPALNPLAQALGMKLLGMTHAPGQMTAQQPPIGGSAPDAGIAGADAEGYDYDTIEPALDKMRRVFPNVEMTLEKLADWVAQNPDQARMVFGNLNQPA